VRQLRLHIQIDHQHHRGERHLLADPDAELAVLHVPLQDAHHLLRVTELDLGHLVEDHGVPSPHQADAPAGQVDEQPRPSHLPARKHVRVVADVPVQVRLARLARRHLDAVGVRLHERHQPREEQQLLAPRVGAGVQAQRVDEQLHPLVARELRSLGDVVVELDPSDLEWRELQDHERPDLLVVDDLLIIADGHGAPHASMQERLVGADQGLVHVQEALVEGGDGAPVAILRLLQAHF